MLGTDHLRYPVYEYCIALDLSVSSTPPIAPPRHMNDRLYAVYALSPNGILASTVPATRYLLSRDVARATLDIQRIYSKLLALVRYFVGEVFMRTG